ncbi:ABC transporter substrate-binding protein [Paenibacillus sp. RC67]|uniref:ABC transporter substrate-binding protein n=1 Tax=Paenibacillus sp. RC67 TaxID=3039392 RepID=UPI0024AD44A6|nr:ABC transporter substrate-binding protein [Paenibacillus sp. RC67]
MNQAKLTLLGALIMASTALTACSGSMTSAPESSQNPSNTPPAYGSLSKPVTIVFQSAYNETSLESVEQTMFKRVKEKFPNVTPVYVPRGKGSTIQDLITTGSIPDVLWGNLSTVNDMMISTKLSYDLTDLFKKYNYDLTQFSQTALDGIRNVSDKGQLIGLPKNNLKPAVLFYNKDLFDKFGVTYPKDGMTWDELYDLAKKMTRIEAGEQFYGFSMFPNALLRDNSLSVAAMDAKEDKLNSSDQWSQIFTNLKRFYEISGNDWKDQDKKFREGKAAMFVDLLTSSPSFTKANLNWDMAALPVYKEMPGVGSRIPYDYYFITQTSKNKEAAFELITFLLSEEFQLGDAKDGFLPSTTKIDILKSFGTNVEGLNGKNLKALTVKPADALPKRNPGLAPINTDTNISKAFERVATGAEDVNTSLRKADEEIRKAAEEYKQRK